MKDVREQKDVKLSGFEFISCGGKVSEHNLDAFVRRTATNYRIKRHGNNP